jgi:cell division protease FtsH
MTLLHDKGVEVNVAAAPSPWAQVLLTNGLPLLLLLVVMVILGRRTARGQQDGLLGFGRTRARHYDAPAPGEKGVTFDDVAGVDEAKSELMDIVDFLREPDKYHSIGAHIPRGVLLVGPPGTGKTLMARGIAARPLPFYNLNASRIRRELVAWAPAVLRDLFATGQRDAPSYCLYDELDAVGCGGAGWGVNDDANDLNQLLWRWTALTIDEIIVGGHHPPTGRLTLPCCGRGASIARSPSACRPAGARGDPAHHTGHFQLPQTSTWGPGRAHHRISAPTCQLCNEPHCLRPAPMANR